MDKSKSTRKALFLVGHAGVVRHIEYLAKQMSQSERWFVETVILRKKKGFKTLETNSVSDWPKSKIISKLTKCALEVSSCTPYFNSLHRSRELRFRNLKIGGKFPLLKRVLQFLSTKSFFRELNRQFFLLTSHSKRHRKYLQSVKPDVLICTNSVWSNTDEYAYILAAKRLGISCIAVIPSWDNLTTKGTFQVTFDAVFVWNEVMKNEAVALHKISRDKVFAIGAYPFEDMREYHETNGKKYTKTTEATQYLLYLCSSPSICPNESKIISKLIELLKRHKLFRKYELRIRPHPLSSESLDTLLDCGLDVMIEQPDHFQKSSRDVFFRSFREVALVFGLNTSAFLESLFFRVPVISIPHTTVKQGNKFGHRFILEDMGAVPCFDDWQALGIYLTRKFQVSTDLQNFRSEAINEFIDDFILAGRSDMPSKRFLEIIEKKYEWSG